MPKCLMFKYGLNITTRGTVKPCCIFRPGEEDLRVDMYDIDKAREYFEKLYEESLNKWIPQCVNCSNPESQGEDSLRISSAKIFNQKLGSGIRYLDMEINNTCNLTCRMCSPHSSSKWGAMVKNNPMLEWIGHEKRAAQAKYGWHKDLNSIKHLLKHLQVLKFTGGEPFLIPQVKQIIDYVCEQGIAPQIKLKIITNGTVELTQWFEKLAQFDEVDLAVSMEATGKRFEYMRPGASWEQVSENCIAMQNMITKHNAEDIEVRIVPLTSVLNFTQIETLGNWAKQHGMVWHGSEEIIEPMHMTLQALKPELREKYNVKSVFPYKEEAWLQLCKQMEIQDSIHGTDFRTTCPELFDA